MRDLRFHLPAPSLLPRLDWPLIAAATALSIAGIITIWGASSEGGVLAPFGGFARAQFKWFLLGWIVMLAIGAGDYRLSRALAWPLYGLLLVLLVLVLIHGRRVNGSMSWFIMHIGGARFQFQPAEPGKVIAVIALARLLADRARPSRSLRDTLAPILLLAVPLLLILRQPDFGTAITYLPAAAVMLFVAGVRKRVFILFLLAGIAVAAIGYPHLRDYQKARIESFLHPGEDLLGRDYNVAQAQTALGSGRMTGKGLAKGTQTSFRFLPEYQTDFIFPTLGEQFGFLGCAAVLALYGLLLARAVYLAGRARDIYGTLLVSGLATIIAVHILLNIGMVTGLMPVTGVPLPFFSYGGSFMLTCQIMIGLMAGVSGQRAQ